MYNCAYIHTYYIPTDTNTYTYYELNYKNKFSFDKKLQLGTVWLPWRPSSGVASQIESDAWLSSEVGDLFVVDG